MGSKATGKHYTSNGERRSSISTRATDDASKIINIRNAYWKGQNPWVTIDNPNRENTKERKIRVRANELWGNPKEREKQRFIMK
jgi:hypothetical protein